MILEVIQQDNPIIRAENKPVTEITEEVISLISNMKETMEPNKLAGIAAPQVAKNLQIFIAINYHKDKEGNVNEEQFVFINPNVLSYSEAADEWYEGCGSVQNSGIFGPVVRAKRIRIEAMNEKGETFQLKAEGYFARVIQHEYDHLKGILFTDRIEDQSRILSKEEYEKLRNKEKENKKEPVDS